VWQLILSLAMAYSSLGKMEEAHEAASQVLKLNPNFSLEDFAKAQVNKDEEDRVFGMDASTQSRAQVR